MDYEISVESNLHMSDNNNNSPLQNESESDNGSYYDDLKFSRRVVNRRFPEDFVFNVKSYLKSSELSDIVLVVRNVKFHCHRIILASVSPYFATMFRCNMNEQRQSEIILKSIDGKKVMKQVIKYMYTGTTVINKFNMHKMYQAADFFQIASLRDLCVAYIRKNVARENCIEMYHFACLYQCEELKAASGSLFPYILSQVSKQDKFLELPVDVASSLLIMCHSTDNHSPEEEANVFKAVVAWLRYAADRHVFATNIFQSVAFIALRKEFLEEIVLKENLVVECKEAMKNVNKALQFYQTPMRKSEIDIDINHYSLAHREKGGTKFDLYTETPVGVVKGLIFLEKNDNLLMNINDKFVLQPLCRIRLKMRDILVTWNNSVYIVGVMSSNVLFLYMPKKGTLSKKASSHYNRKHFAFNELDGKLYAVGGMQNNILLNVAECYDPTSNTWTDIVPLPQPLSKCASVSCQGKLYIVGGVTQDHQVSTSVFSFNPTSNKWKCEPSMPCGRCDAVAVVMNSHIYVIGGKNYHGKKEGANTLTVLVKKVDVFDPATGCWSQGPDLPNDIVSIKSVAKSGDKIIVLCEVKETSGHKLQDFTLRCSDLTEWKYGHKEYLHLSIFKAATQTAILDKVIVKKSKDEDDEERYSSDDDHECECKKCRRDIRGLTTDDDGSGADAPSDSNEETY